MFKNFVKCVAIVFVAALMAGCTVRSYVQERGRVDQEMSGNAGCIQGTCESVDRSNLKTTRETYVLEFVTGPEKIEAAPTTNVSSTTTEVYPEETAAPYSRPQRNYNLPVVEEEPLATEPSFVEYKIQEGDTLQKISKKFYNTYQRWNEIYEANRDVLSSPDRIKPGKTIRIPQK